MCFNFIKTSSSVFLGGRVGSVNTEGERDIVSNMLLSKSLWISIEKQPELSINSLRERLF